jgi:hypothetical protein
LRIRENFFLIGLRGLHQRLNLFGFSLGLKLLKAQKESTLKIKVLS